MSKVEVNEKVYDHRTLSDWSDVDGINTTNGNNTILHLPIDMVFNDGHRLSIAVYSILMVISAMGNSTVLYLLTKRRLRGPSRIDIMLMHLAIADLLVTFLLMPLEIVWAYTVTWNSTDFTCRLMSFFRVFGLYLSSFVLVCISIDRYFAVLRPLKMSTTRGRLMLLIAWIGSCVCSSPQAIIFHVERHPKVRWYKQCVTFHSFSDQFHEMLYQVLGMLLMYALPLTVIIYCYASIYVEIYRKSKPDIKEIDRFRRSNDGVLGRAKRRTLKMTVIIVIVFVVCWTPYYIMCMWYWLDRESALKVDQRIQKGLFLFASTNSCMNPIVYGAFNVRGRTQNKDKTTISNRTTSISKPRLELSSSSMHPHVEGNCDSNSNNSGKNKTILKHKTTEMISSKPTITTDNSSIKLTVTDLPLKPQPHNCSSSCVNSIELANLQKP